MNYRHLIPVIILISGHLYAEDWTTWGGNASRNMVNTTEKNIPTSWDLESKENIKWIVELGSQTYGNPVIHEGKILVGTNNGREYDPEITGDKGIIVCVKEDTGEFLWQIIHDKLPSGRVNDWPEQGICSTVAAEGDKFWYVSNQCQLVCADIEGFMDEENDGPYKDEKYNGPKHGDIIWIYDMMEELGVFPHNLATSSPLLIGDHIYLVTGNGVDEGHLFIPSPRSPSFICVNKNTGELVWESTLPGKNILHGQWSSACYGEAGGKKQVVFPGGDGWVYSLDADTGELVWKFDTNPKDAIWELGGRGTRNNIIGTPVFLDGKVYIANGQDPEHGIGKGHMFCIDAAKTGDITESGKIWQFSDLSRSMSTCAIYDGLVVIPDLNGFLYCLDAATGKQHWKYDTLAAVWGSATIIDGNIYLGDEDGDVAILKASSTLEEISEQTLDNTAYSTPVAANGVLYITSRNELFAFTQSK